MSTVDPDRQSLHSPMIEAAVRLAARGHYRQFRKRDNPTDPSAIPGDPLPEDHIPYITHLMGTMNILARLGAADEVLAAAALHDYLEDVPDSDGRQRIREITNDRVLELVAALTEDKRPELGRGETWETRKREKLIAIDSMSDDAILIKAADLLHNLLTLEIDLGKSSDHQAVWNRFNAPKEMQLWYFTSTLEALRRRLGDHRLVTEMAAVLGRIRA